MKAWHITSDTLSDGRPLPAVGVRLVHDGPVVPCESGLHASERLIDALSYAPEGARWIHRVELGGEIVAHDGDKHAASERTILASYPLDLRRVVRLACECASLAAWCAGLWLPDLIVAAEAADVGNWAAARHAAGAGAGAAAGAAARDAAWAARAAAGAARAGAWAARAWAWHAAWDAAWHAAWDAAWHAAWAARAAARAGAWDAAWAAAWDAAWDAAWGICEARAVALLTDGSDR